MLGPDKQTNEGLRRTWWWGCQDENITAAKPARLPLLFALDSKLGIAKIDPLFNSLDASP